MPTTRTSRVSGAPSGTQRTSRLSFLLLVEGEYDGLLLLEGDAQSGTDALKLEGDMTTISGTVTRRITGAVTTISGTVTRRITGAVT